MIRAAIDADPKLEVIDCWKSITTADVITFIDAAMDELKPETANAAGRMCGEKPSMISKDSQGSTEK